MGTIYQGKSGTTYMIEDKSLASGGEGSIYAIQGYKESVLKVFKPDRRNREREEKLLKMVEYQLSPNQLNQVTWPQDVVYDQNGFVGYVMPRLWDNENLNKVYSTQDNKYDLRHRMLIAFNLCVAIDTVHSLNQVCGDLNPQNICVNLNPQSKSAFRVTLVDTDSYHITDEDKTYRCEVGLANYLAPEIQNKLTNGRNLKTAPLPTYTKETDLFALAVHIFSLAMNGCHPFACAKQTNNGFENTMEAMNDKDCESVVLPQPIDNIKDGFFPFHQQRNGVTYPLYAPDFNLLPQELQGMFIRAFENGYDNPKERPTAAQWLEVLGKYQAPMEFMKCEKNHYYYNNGNHKCPYCEARQRMMRMMSRQSYTEPKKEHNYNQQTGTTTYYGAQNVNLGKQGNPNSSSKANGNGAGIGALPPNNLRNLIILKLSAMLQLGISFIMLFWNSFGFEDEKIVGLFWIVAFIQFIRESIGKKTFHQSSKIVLSLDIINCVISGGLIRNIVSSFLIFMYCDENVELYYELYGSFLIIALVIEVLFVIISIWIVVRKHNNIKLLESQNIRELYHKPISNVGTLKPIHIIFVLVALVIFVCSMIWTDYLFG